MTGRSTAIVGAATGQPITAYAGTMPGLNGGPSGTGYTDSQRPNRTSEPCRGGGGPDEQIINPDAYTLNGFQLGTNRHRRAAAIAPDPDTSRRTWRFYKNFPLGGGARFQFRWDIFNIFNNTNFLFAGHERDDDSVGRDAEPRRHPDRQRDHPGELRSGDAHARPETDADRVQDSVVSPGSRRVARGAADSTHDT